MDVNTPGFWSQPRLVRSVSDTRAARVDARTVTLLVVPHGEDVRDDRDDKEARSESELLEQSMLEATAVASMAEQKADPRANLSTGQQTAPQSYA